MQIKTPFGIINENEIKQLESISDNLQSIIDSAELFFQDTAEINKVSGKLYFDLFDSLLEINNYIDDKDKLFCLVDFLIQSPYTDIEIDLKEIEENGENTFLVDDSDFLVLLPDEVRVNTIDYIESSLDDLGIKDLLGDRLTNQIYTNSDLLSDVGKDELQTFYEDDTKNQLEELELEEENEEPDEDIPYLNELHQEMVQNNIMEEPEWDEEPEDPETKEWEDWNTDYFNQISEIEQEITVKFDEMVKKRLEDYDEPVEWMIDNFGEEFLKEYIDRASVDIFDNRKIAGWLFDNDETSPGNELSSYDNLENIHSCKYYSKDLEYHIFRRD